MAKIIYKCIKNEIISMFIPAHRDDRKVNGNCTFVQKFNAKSAVLFAEPENYRSKCCLPFVALFH